MGDMFSAFLASSLPPFDVTFLSFPGSEALFRSDLGGLAAERQKDVCAAALGTLRVLLISCAPAMLSAQRDRVRRRACT